MLINVVCSPAHNGIMPKPRKRLVSLSTTPYYHCISRCVRRAFLCGTDPLTGFDFSHRRGWIVSRLKELAGVFAIDLCAYAVMSNHYHVVLRVNQEQAGAWTDREVAERWLALFTGPVLVHRWLAGDPLDESQLEAVNARIDTWRRRLYDLSWFMRCLNEAIARMANREDHCTGRFWEGRFRSDSDQPDPTSKRPVSGVKPSKSAEKPTFQFRCRETGAKRMLYPTPLGGRPLRFANALAALAFIGLVYLFVLTRGSLFGG